jgi:hypothetical protein
MPAVITPPRSALAGTALLMACACGTADNSAKLLGLAGVAATTTMVHPVFLSVAAGLILYGLWRISERSGRLAAGAFVLLAIGAALTPPRVMTVRELPWNTSQMAGGLIYLAAAAVLGYAFWRAFPSPRPAASGTAMGGMVMASGCTCCMFTGAMAGMAVTSGAPPALETTDLIFWSGLALVAAGLYQLGGWTAAAWVPVGGLVIQYAPTLLAFTGDWMVGPANLRSFPSYMITVTGAGIVLYGFVSAYRTAGAADGWRGADAARAPEAVGA